MAAHRADQVLDAVVAKLVAASLPAEKHRELSYDGLLEVPAISVRFGPDAADSDRNIPIIDSVLTVSILAVVRQATEAEAVAELLELRKSIHIALLADRTLGLSFVSDTRYGGAGAPEFDTSGEGIAARQETTWAVPYRTSLLDPSQ